MRDVCERKKRRLTKSTSSACSLYKVYRIRPPKIGLINIGRDGKKCWKFSHALTHFLPQLRSPHSHKLKWKEGESSNVGQISGYIFYLLGAANWSPRTRSPDSLPGLAPRTLPNERCMMEQTTQTLQRVRKVFARVIHTASEGGGGKSRR